jgi:hypothetical protein
MWSDAISDFERPGPRLRDYVRAVKACFTAFRSGKLDHHGDFYDLDFITPQWSAGPIDAPDPKVDRAVNPWMLRMAARSPMACTSTRWANQPPRHVIPNVAEGAAKSGRSPSDIALIVPVMTIVGDTDEERHRERELVRTSMSFYGSTPNYAFIWDQAGFDGTTARIREKQKAATSRRMAAQITDDHIATFATESTWDGLADALAVKYGRVATRIALYNALGDPERTERYGTVAKTLAARSSIRSPGFSPGRDRRALRRDHSRGLRSDQPAYSLVLSDPGPPMGCHDRQPKTSSRFRNDVGQRPRECEGHGDRRTPHPGAAHLGRGARAGPAQCRRAGGGGRGTRRRRRRVGRRTGRDRPDRTGVWMRGASLTMLHQPTPRTDLARWAGRPPQSSP